MVSNKTLKDPLYKALEAPCWIIGESSSHEEEWRALEEKMRDALRLRHRSLNTEKTCLVWLRGFRRFVSVRQPAVLEGRNLQDFLNHLAVEKKIFPSTQNQALNAIVFLYRHVLDKDIDKELSAVRSPLDYF